MSFTYYKITGFQNLGDKNIAFMAAIENRVRCYEALRLSRNTSTLADAVQAEQFVHYLDSLPPHTVKISRTHLDGGNYEVVDQTYELVLHLDGTVTWR